MNFSLLTETDASKNLAERHKQLRLLRKWKRTTLADRSGVPVSSIIRFEQTAQISLKNLLMLFSAMGRLQEIETLLLPPEATSIDDLEKQGSKIIKRGSR
ncbi:MAG: hypothetical protein B6241_02350 [Spirochaetaceae bacterium 4572_59]|nr:MAG: hypothetical protein B6241_02350 [Spirochaetaceae bacterium 4572_59]